MSLSYPHWHPAACTFLPACLTRSYSGVGTLQARAKEERLVRGPLPPSDEEIRSQRYAATFPLPIS